jgi:peptidoglycan/xylan/chitin deacetylase (PgdA/CDA1 family)
MSKNIRHILGPIWPALSARRKIFSGLNTTSSGEVNILLYHAIPEQNLLQFQKQIASLSSRYQFITPDQFHSFIDGELDLDGLHLLITFDDGFLSSKLAAEQVLNPHGIKALFFVVVDYIDSATTGNWQEFAHRNLFEGMGSREAIGPEYFPSSWKDLADLRDDGHSIASHGMSHAHLTKAEPRELARELGESARVLQRELGVPVTDFAFPYGSLENISLDVMSAICETYQYCYSGIRGRNRRNTLPMTILRESISPADPVSYVNFQTENGLAPLYAKRAKALLQMATDGAR